MIETIRFRPETIAWWGLLLQAEARLRRVWRWEVAAQGPDPRLIGLHQHPTDTLVLCLAGGLRIEDGRQRRDLAPGDAVLVRPGAWHRHAPLRRRCLAYQQGVIAGRSDFLLAAEHLQLIGSLPEQPARRMLAGIGEASDEAERIRRLRALLLHLRGEAVEPLLSQHPAGLAMECALWENLHRGDAVRRIIRASGLARAQAYRQFQRHWGGGIASAVRSERMILARSLLEAGLGVGETAARCGIAGRRSFTRSFRRHWGVPPNLVGRGPCRRTATPDGG